MTEEQKRHLDAIRERDPHPAVTYDQLPEEAQSYINELELDAYDAKQGALVARTVLVSALGAVLIDANFLHLINVTNMWAAISAVPLLVLPWLFYFWQWRRNADEFLPPGIGLPDWSNPTDEKLRAAWEIDHLTKGRPGHS